MNKRRDITIEIVLMIAMIGLTGLTVFGAPEGGSGTVRLTGKLHSFDRTMVNMVVVVELDGDRCGSVELHPNGKFNILVPVDSEVLLSFSKPGHLSKEIRLNTKNAIGTQRAGKEDRVVEFDVVMGSVENRRGRHFSGPVGSLSFVNGSGTMKVRHHPIMIADPVE